MGNSSVRIAIIVTIIFSLVCLVPVFAQTDSTDQVGKINILSVPNGATISIDGKDVGTTPSMGTVSFGKHRVDVSYPGYNSYSTEIVASPDSRTFILTPVLTTRNTSYIVVNSFPSGASIALDGKVVGTTPHIGIQFMGQGNNFLLLNKVPYGNHTITASLPGFSTQSARITLVPPQGGIASFNFGKDTLSGAYGSLGVASEPEGGKVYLDSVYKGMTPLYLVNNVTPGTHQLKITRDGNRDFSTNITVIAGKVSSMTAYMANVSPSSASPTTTKAGLPVPVIFIGLALALFSLGAVNKK